MSIRRQGTTIFYAIRDPLLVEVLDVARRFLIVSLSENETLLASLRAADRR